MLIVQCKQDKPHWGAPKMRERLARLLSVSTPDAGVPQRPRPTPDAHASLLKLPPPQIIFSAATPASSLRPLVWMNAP
jgi:hypothetical protein